MQGTDSIRTIKGIGEKMEKLFAKVGIHTVEELLHYYPRDYEVYENLVQVKDLREGQVAAIQVVLESVPKMSRVRNLRILTTYVHDVSGRIQVSWFNMPYIMKQLHLGKKYIFRGKVVRKNGILVLNQPKIVEEQEFYNSIGKWQPIYPLTEGLTNRAITKAVSQALQETELKKDSYPLALRKEYQLLEHKAATRAIHFPLGKEELISARKRFVFEEFYEFMEQLQKLKEQKGKCENGYCFKDIGVVDKIISGLNYPLTNAQKRTLEELKKDLTSGQVMNRLIQGDVGSGKTIIAIIALAMAVSNGFQGAIMVPTEVLARQHMVSFSEILKPLGIRMTLLTGALKVSEKKEAYEKIKNHETDIIIGTHALIQEKVEYANLGLVVTDEQHRFGVRQREKIAEKGQMPHMLVMSATPIPRTLAIILYGDLDISVIDELPANRLPIKNCVVGTNYRKSAYTFMEKEVKAGHQVYVICPMVEESENIEAENVIEYAQRLQTIFPETVRVEYLHGKMKASQKNEIMDKFTEGKVDVLVSTTVIEVGVNVPNATVMLIENAERFGLAQLHQLRGRVGRGGNQSYCIFMSGTESKDAMERLQVLGQSNDGFYVAEWDLKFRGPGDLFGVRQSGEFEFVLGDIYSDADMLKAASEAVKKYGNKQDTKENSVLAL